MVAKDVARTDFAQACHDLVREAVLVERIPRTENLVYRPHPLERKVQTFDVSV